MKYAMIAINHQDSAVRRVLIRYKKKKHVNKQFGLDRFDYVGTVLISKDYYFDNPDSSHQYNFENDGYTLTTDNYDGLLTDKRPYHYFVSDYPHATPIEFEAKNDKIARALFDERNINAPLANILLRLIKGDTNYFNPAWSDNTIYVDGSAELKTEKEREAINEYKEYEFDINKCKSKPNKITK